MRLKDPADAEALAITLVNCADIAFEDIEYVIIFMDGYEPKPLRPSLTK